MEDETQTPETPVEPIAEVEPTAEPVPTEETPAE